MAAGVDCSLSPQGRSLEPGRGSALALAKLVDLDLERLVDLLAALGEHVTELVGDAGDLGLTLHDRYPVDPETVRELVAQHRLVQAAEHPLMPFQVAAIERVPLTLGLHLR